MAVTVNRLLRLIPAVGLMLVGCATAPPAQDPVLLRLTDMEARLIRMERVIENQSLIELATQVDQLQAQTQELRGQIETLRFESENAGNRQRQLYLDVDQRLQSIEQNQTRFAEPPPVAVFDPAEARAAQAQDRPVVSGSDQDNYQAAFDMLVFEQGFYFTRKGKHGIVPMVIQRFFSKTIPGQKVTVLDGI